MRIGMMTDTYKPHISGVTNYISLNKKALEQAGHEVFVFTFGDVDYLDDEPNIIRSPGLPLVNTGFYLGLRYKASARRLLYTMDLIHVHHPFLSGTLALSLCRPRGIPIAFTSHTRYDLYAHAYLPILPEVVGETVISAYLPVFCRACDLVVAPSEGMRKVLQHLGVDSPVLVAPNGVDMAPFSAIHHPVNRAELGFQPADIVLVYVGRLGPEKNLPFLLRSFTGVANAYENMRLLIVGDGPERDNLQDRVRSAGIGDKVFFTGLIPYDRLPQYLAAADAFVTASITEVHPLSVIEAMASGLPVLGIESPGVGDIIVNGETGFLSSNDLASFTAKMIRLVTENELRKEMGRQAKVASEAYSIERTAGVMLHHYQALVRQTEPHRRHLRSRMTRLLDRWRT